MAQPTTPPRRMREHIINISPHWDSSAASFSSPPSGNSSPGTATPPDPADMPDYGYKAFSRVRKPSARQLAAVAESRELERHRLNSRVMGTYMRETDSALLVHFGYRAICGPDEGGLGIGRLTRFDFCNHVRKSPDLASVAATYATLGPATRATHATLTAHAPQPKHVDAAALLHALAAGTNIPDSRDGWDHLNAGVHGITVAEVCDFAAHIARHGLIDLLPLSPSMGTNAFTHFETYSASGTATVALLQLLANVLGVADCANVTTAELSAFEDGGHKVWGFRDHLAAIRDGAVAAGHPYVKLVEQFTKRRYRELWVDWSARMGREKLLTVPADLALLDQRHTRQRGIDKAEHMAEMTEMRAQADATRVRLDLVTDTLASYIDETAQLEGTIVTLQGQNQALNSTLASYIDKTAQLEGTIVTLQGQNQALNSTLEANIKETTKLKGTIVTLKGQNQDLNSTLASYIDKTAQLEGTIVTLQGQNQELNSTLASYIDKTAQLEGTIVTLQAQMSARDAQQEAMNRRLDELFNSRSSTRPGSSNSPYSPASSSGPTFFSNPHTRSNTPSTRTNPDHDNDNENDDHDEDRDNDLERAKRRRIA
ncbi:hypothetical protein DFH27DRAFT_581317 [Peziza echinospora]|nr:hypothetical protein DFH27DRAFT_581317 [Peziza echinospora]